MAKKKLGRYFLFVLCGFTFLCGVFSLVLGVPFFFFLLFSFLLFCLGFEVVRRKIEKMAFLMKKKVCFYFIFFLLEKPREKERARGDFLGGRRLGFFKTTSSLTLTLFFSCFICSFVCLLFFFCVCVCRTKRIPQMKVQEDSLDQRAWVELQFGGPNQRTKQVFLSFFLFFFFLFFSFLFFSFPLLFLCVSPIPPPPAFFSRVRYI